MTPFSREKDFEEALIRMLSQKGWEKEVLREPTEEQLIDNWAHILYQNNNTINRLNNAPLTKGEMAQLLEQIRELKTPVALNGFINGRTVHIKRDNAADPLHLGREVSLKIFDPQEIAAGESRYQIVSQPRYKRSAPLLHDRRGDLTLLINGMPVIHIELKRSGIPVSQAYHQIEKYSREGIFGGLFSLIQIFVAMTPEETVYFANPGPEGRFNRDFYFHWADFNNTPRNDWEYIATYLLSIPMAHQLIGYYTIADQTDGVLKVLRSYQYEAVRAIVDRVTTHTWDSDDGQLGGYIWHTTGSGKTMSSFKAAQLIAMNKRADKVIFVIDRIELGTQSAREYRNFAGVTQEIQETENTDVLVSKLISDDVDDTLIVTSIQKLGIIADSDEHRSRLSRDMPRRIVFIVDECHRSTFGETFADIKATFPRALFFGFTGTPIEEDNRRHGSTTSDIFGKELHRYSIADGIRDRNVLGFDPYKVSTFRDRDLRLRVALSMAGAESVEEVYGDPERERIYDDWMNRPMAGEVGEDGTYLSGVEDMIPPSQYETEEHCRAVVGDIAEDLRIRSRGGKFHALFTTSSIRQAIRYYRLFKEIAPELRVTALFDPSLPNDNPDKILEKECGLEEILGDYNERYGQRFDMASHDKFKKDIASRLAHKAPYIHIKPEATLDLLIVVSQMLTGFDSKWVNTLYIDKMMEYDELIQAFSRTNRLYGPEKPFGIIKYYQRPHTMERNIRKAVRLYSGDRPLSLFVSKLGENIEGMNKTFDEIKHLFESDGIENFARLPEEDALRARFAKLFRSYNHFLEAAKAQSFRWDKSVYLVEGTLYRLSHDEHDYNTLLRRYKELYSEPTNPSTPDGDFPYDIDPYLVEINTDKIDTDYMNRNFDRYVKALKQEGVSKEELEQLLNDLSASYSTLSQEEQKFAEILLHDIQSNNVVLDPGKTFRDYITEYMTSERERIREAMVQALGLDRALLVQILDSHPTSKDLDQHRRFSDLCDSADRERARLFFEKREGREIPPFRVSMMLDKYLREYILCDRLPDPNLTEATAELLPPRSPFARPYTIPGYEESSLQVAEDDPDDHK